MEKEFICIVCPRGCHVKVNGDSITGNSCPRGLNYVKQEMSNPTRMLTTTVRVDDENIHVCPVRTESPIPKGLIFKAMEEVNKVTVKLPIKMHQIIVENVLGTGVNIVASKEIN